MTNTTQHTAPTQHTTPGKLSARLIPMLDCSLVDISLDPTVAVAAAPPTPPTHTMIGRRALLGLLTLSRRASLRDLRTHYGPMRVARASGSRAALALAQLDLRHDSDIPWQGFLNNLMEITR